MQIWSFVLLINFSNKLKLCAPKPARTQSPGTLTAMPRRAAPQRSTLNDNGFYPEYAVGFLLRPEIAVLRQAQHRLASASLGFLSSE